MSVIAICGLPGSGKTLFATYIMRKHYRKENGFFKRVIFRDKIFNNVFTNYPIKLDKHMFSKRITLSDLNFDKSYYQDSDIVLDEIQSYFDSLDFKAFPKVLANFFQFHRHFGIRDIYLISQHPSRIVKQMRILVCEFYDITRFVKIPFTPFCFFRYNIYYNFEDFGKSVQVKKSDVTYKFKKRFLFFNYKKVYKSYDTKYMKHLLDGKELIKNKKFKQKDLNKQELKEIFNISDEPSG